MKYITVEPDIYTNCLQTAKRYYILLRRRKELEDEIIHSGVKADGMPRAMTVSRPTERKAERIIIKLEEVDRKIAAIEKAWATMPDKESKEFIRLNLFVGMPMQYINLPLSYGTMKNRRRSFILRLAENLYEI